MLCPNCNSNTISVSRIIFCGVGGHYRCPVCKTTSTTQANWLSALTVLLISLPIILGFLLRSFNIFAISFFVGYALAVLLFVRFGRLKKARRDWSTTSLVVNSAFLVFIAWLCFAVWNEEPLDPGFEAFFAREQAALEDVDNAAVALSGINAPVGVDVIAFGRTKVDSWLSTASAESVSNSPTTETPLAFIGSGEELYCWAMQPIQRPANDKCATESRIAELFKTNQTILDRFWWITELQHFQGQTARILSVIIGVQQLIAADIEIKLRRKDYEPAYSEWRRNCGFIFRMLREDTDFVVKAIFLVAESTCLKSAELLVFSYPNIANLHENEMQELLMPAGLVRWNLPGALRAEYAMFDNAILSKPLADWVHPNFIRNRFHSVTKELLAASERPPLEVHAALQKYRDAQRQLWSWDHDHLFDPLNSVYAKFITIGPVTGFSLIQSLHQHDGQLRALSLALTIKQQHMDEEAITRFTKNPPATFLDPFTSLPMDYNPKAKTISFRYGDGSDVREFQVRL